MRPVCVIMPGTAPQPRPQADGIAAIMARAALQMREVFGPQDAVLCGQAAQQCGPLAQAAGLPLLAPAPIDPAEQAEPPWAPDAAAAHAAAAARFPGRGVVLADLSRLTLDEALARHFLDGIAEDPGTPLLAMRECRDHPMQLVRFWRLRDVLGLLRGEPAPGEGGAAILAQSQQSWPAPQRWSWELLPSGLHRLCAQPCPTRLVQCEVLDARGRLLQKACAAMGPQRCTLPLGRLPQEAAGISAAIFSEDLPDYHLYWPLDDAPGLWSRQEDGMLRNDLTGRIVAGRQDFPAIMEPDTLLAYVPPGHAKLPALAQCRAYVLPAGMPGPARGAADTLGVMAAQAYLRARQEEAHA